MPGKTRNTRQKELIKSVVDSFDGFFNSEEIYEKVSKKDKNIGIATVYRYLKEMSNKKELYSYLCDRRTLYSRQKNSHCHFVCEKTGKIIHFDIDNLDFLKNIKNEIPGAITSVQLEIKGICDDCS